MLEVNPRASRTIPFVSKTTNIPLARIAAQIATGKKLKDFNLPPWDMHNHVAVKEAVLPFNKFPEESIFLSPEMKSTGEVMGISNTFGESFKRAIISSGNKIFYKGETDAIDKFLKKKKKKVKYSELFIRPSYIIK